MAESAIGLYKTELIRRRTRWTGIDDVELSTLEWVDWFNHQRLLEPIGYVPPAEFEAAYYRGLEGANDPDAAVEGSIAPASGTTSSANAALRRSERSVSPADGRSGRSEDGSALLVVSVGPRAEDRREVGAYSRNVETQAPESP